MAQLLADGKVEVGAIHTYVELYARMFVDLTPDVALLCAEQADREGNLYTGPNTEDTPTIAEAAAFRDGVVWPRSTNWWTRSPGGHPRRLGGPGRGEPRPFVLEPLFTRDPRQIGQVEILMAMLATARDLRAARGDHAESRDRLRHRGDRAHPAHLRRGAGPARARSAGTGRSTRIRRSSRPSRAAGSSRCTASAANPARSATSPPARTSSSPARDGSLRSNRVLCQLAGQYAVDMFIGSSLQIDADANSSTVTEGRLAGFGGAPNMGHDPHGRRHATPAWLSMLRPARRPRCAGASSSCRSRRPSAPAAQPAFVESLDAIQVGKDAGMPIPPIMIYGDDVSHVVTEEGVAYLYKADQPGRAA